MTSVSPDDVNLLTRPTDGDRAHLHVMLWSVLIFFLYVFFSDIGFLCPLNANTYGIEFLQFAIVDYDTKNCLFEVGKDIPPPADMSLDFSCTGEDIYRKIRYNFSEDVLKLPFIQTTSVYIFLVYVFCLVYFSCFYQTCVFRWRSRSSWF